ncbi:MAG: hypothetical protein WAM64_09265 [Acidimicrobiales bacterium]
MSESDRNEAGRAIIHEMMGEETADKLIASAASGTFGSAISEFAIDQAFGEVWTRRAWIANRAA